MKVKTDIVTVIKQRLNLQSIEKSLWLNYKAVASLDYITMPAFLTLFNSWEDTKKKSFLQTVGGPANYDRTKRFFDNLIK